MAADVEISTEQLIERVGADLAALAERGLTFRNPDELLTVVEAGPRLRAKLDSVLSGAAAEVDRWRLAKDAGYRNVAQLVGDRTGADPSETRADVRLGLWIDDFDEFAAAWGRGDMSTAHLDLIRRKLDCARNHDALRADQTMLIGFAADYDFMDFTAACMYWKNVHDIDGDEPREQIEKTFFSATKDADGCVRLKGFMHPLMGEAFMTAFEHECRKLFREANDHPDGDGADAGAEDAPAETVGHRRARALLGLVTRGFARQDGTFPVPMISAVASEQVIEELLTRIDDSEFLPNREPLPLAFGDIDKRCELLDGTPLHPNYLLATLGLATFRRQILTAAGRTVDLSVNARCFTPWQKHALAVEARGRCRTRGCDAPFSWLEADHIHPYSRGGPTRMSNGKMRCGPENTAKGNKLEEPDEAERPAA